MNGHGEIATATWDGDRWKMQVRSAELCALAVHHGWTLLQPAAPVVAAAPPVVPAPPAQGQQEASAAPADTVEDATLAADARALVDGTLPEVMRRLTAPRWRSEEALLAVLAAESLGDSRKGVRRAVAQARRALRAGG